MATSGGIWFAESKAVGSFFSLLCLYCHAVGGCVLFQSVRSSENGLLSVAASPAVPTAALHGDATQPSDLCCTLQVDKLTAPPGGSCIVSLQTAGFITSIDRLALNEIPGAIITLHGRMHRLHSVSITAN